MKMPKKVYVGHRVYRITRDAKQTPEHGNTDSLYAGYNGMSYHHDGVIWIADTVPDDAVVEILLHEIMHCCIGAMGIQPALRKAAQKDKDPEEGYVLVLAAGLCAVMGDPRNAKVKAFLFPATEG
jgi:hypothetical protein